MTTTTTDLQTTIDYWTSYRTSLRYEAIRTVDKQSREDRLAEVDRITRRLQDLYARLDAMTE